MEHLFSFIASLASIGSIPLAVYFFLRSSEDRYFKIRREIAKLISSEIGEGRYISLFEINSVIKSKAFESRLSRYTVTPAMIIQDIVYETIASTLLSKERKDEIIAQLHTIYNELNPLKYENNLRSKTYFQKSVKKENISGKKSATFGIISIVLSVVIVILVNTASILGLRIIKTDENYTWLLLGAGVAFVSFIISVLIRLLKPKIYD